MTIRSIFITLPPNIPVPHDELFKHITRYGKDVSVGLELATPEKVIDMPPVEFHNQQVHLDLYEHFRKQGNRIHFLETLDDFKEEHVLMSEIVDLEKRLKKTTSHDESERLGKEIDRKGIVAMYTSILGKEEKIARRIGEHKPDVVFLGAAHSSRFYRDAERLKKQYGITFGNYWEDEFAKEIEMDDLTFAASMSSESMPMEEYVQHMMQVRLKRITSPDQALNDTQARQIERLHRAVKERRITDRENPDYIGTWDPQLEHRGLFEMFITSRDGSCIEGTIEDVNGPGKFEGTLCDDEIVFDKTYTPPVSDTAAKGVIRYRAIEKDGVWKGNFRGNDCRGEFWMKSRSA